MNLTDINPLTLPSLPLGERKQLPKCSGIYFVIKDGDILYVGRTANLYQRWLAHHIWQHLYGVSGELRVAWLECSDNELLPKIENALIVHFKPLLNKKLHIPPGAAELSVYIDKELKMEFKLTCVAQNKSMSEVISELVKQWVESQPQKQSPKNHSDKGAA